MPEPPGRLLTVDAYAALGENDRYRSELQDGNLVISPTGSRPVSRCADTLR